MSWSIKSILPLPAKTLSSLPRAPAGPSARTSREQGCRAQGAQLSHPVLPTWARLDLRQLTPERILRPGLSPLQSSLLLTTALSSLGCRHFFGTQTGESKRKYCALHVVFKGKRTRLRRRIKQVPTCHCAWSRWQQRCGCTPASGHGSARGKPSQTWGMEQGHQSESVQIQNPHCFRSRCPLL